ncbi:ribosome biogenesis GTPase Der [Candidatus Falkowbacteria bacterium RIFOXYB2_FULL_34_18]|uniref:GTPase Der n=1 Tax=Candidatus Falkowbacteria bacterium RIFOXYD2_FULL_34_120 TaxID=1798007 RepID=A0A1F5TRX9_9BACT|nr:MAG: ribosome biogenesis GTPase Der [Candidatus Falkowbacteria bacterium RIFOXYB2_FULL_34_18]OGF29933.1 MAG: ribosome biogenesis GTPase Der [Candidatus Falkowbacteria bacterium RIFOXYC12_FULL_34_55]OGF37209.1 MAG: ribosome biogenesis GTPase Der [Candidatus Falkowbacteria bacterium RIFOXYC2_FULL_34_220]OGF39471.1 MAG: ribosome biogenesis GTPase Der [Candidatus Falkowbacteria bacterium RIFOXYD12_FULL_34_57]OGF41547.1 MAG: ribosome biogenesis GTPase Der [Candidatus Falkowbacteria bacterium RIFO
MQTKNNLPLVVLFGRTNVGKSTLFNCLIEQNKAIISDIAGTTRDSNIGTVEWNGKKFKLVDTGGIMNIKNLSKKKVLTDDIDTKVQNQAREFLMRADLILFLVDTRTGLLPPDKEMALILKKIIPKNKTKVILIANKTDSPSLQKETAEFNKLGLGEPVNVSATTGSGTGDMLDIVIKKLQSAPWVKTKKTSSVLLRDSKPVKKNELKETSIEKEDCINVCILGKPNVGKSSLINAILGEERVIVSATPHTTREPQDTEIIYKNKKINLIDTAGISKQGQRGAKKIKFKKALEKQSIEKTLWILNRSNIALLVLDINEGLTHQDSKLVEEIVNRNISLIIIGNKWDLIKEKNTKKYTENIYYALPFAAWAPIQFLSAKTGNKVQKTLDLILEIYEQRIVKIDANPLNKFLAKIIKKHRPVKARGTKHPHIFELKQETVNPPKFSIRIGAKDTIHFSYLQFIKNRLREKFGFHGTPLTIYVDKNKRIHGKHEIINENTKIKDQN